MNPDTFLTAVVHSVADDAMRNAIAFRYRPDYGSEADNRTRILIRVGEKEHWRDLLDVQYVEVDNPAELEMQTAKDLVREVLQGQICN